MPAISECAGNAYRSDGVKPVSVLHNFSLNRFHPGLYARTLERYFGDDVADMANSFCGYRIFFKNIPGYFWANSIISSVEFPIRNIVEQRGKLHYKKICAFTFGDMFRHIPHPNDMPPIVSGALAGKFLFYRAGNYFNDLLLFWIHGNQKLLLALSDETFSLSQKMRVNQPPGAAASASSITSSWRRGWDSNPR